MHEVISESAIIFRVLRECYRLPDDAPVVVIYEIAARKQGISWCKDIARVDYHEDFLARGIVAAYVEAEFNETLTEEQKTRRQEALAA